MIVEHVGGVSPDGTLTVFWWSPAHDWQALNVSSIAGGVVNGRTVSWLAGGVEHMAAHGRNNELFVYWWTPATNWRLVDVTAITGVSIAEVSAAYQLAETGATVELLAARGVDNALLRFWWRPNRDWQAQNLTLATGGVIGTDGLVAPSGSALVEHAAAATPQQSSSWSGTMARPPLDRCGWRTDRALTESRAFRDRRSCGIRSGPQIRRLLWRQWKTWCLVR
jgi:hypothetical protein